MSTCSKNMLITAVITVIVTVLLVLLVLYLSKKSGGGGGTSSDDVISGVWYHDLDTSSDKQRVVVTIGQCTNEEGVYEPLEVDGQFYPMCGSMLVQGISSKIVQGSEVYCADCLFRFTDGNGLEMYSKCIQNYANDFKGPLFSGWVYNAEKNIITTGSGDLIPVSADIIGVFSSINDDNDDVNICQRKRFDDVCEDVCPTCKEIPCKGYSMCGSDDKCTCPR